MQNISIFQLYHSSQPATANYAKQMENSEKNTNFESKKKRMAIQYIPIPYLQTKLLYFAFYFLPHPSFSVTKIDSIEAVGRILGFRLPPHSESIEIDRQTQETK